MKKRTVTILKLLLCLFLAFIFLFSAVAISIVAYSKKDFKEKSDVIIVLGAATNNISISPVFRERIGHAIRLYNNGYSDYILITGGLAEGNEVSDSQKAKEYALSLGVPEESVLIEEKSTITEENLKFAKEIMKENNFDTAIIVSDPLHMKRAIYIAKDMEIQAFSSPTTTSRYITVKTQIPFLLREEILYIGYVFLDIFR